MQECLSSKLSNLVQTKQNIYKTKNFDTKAEQWRTEQELYGKFNLTFSQISPKASYFHQLEFMISIQNKSVIPYWTGRFKQI